MSKCFSSSHLGHGSLTAQSGALCSSTQQLVDRYALISRSLQHRAGPVTVLQHSHILQDSHWLCSVLHWVAWQESAMKSCARKLHRECIRRERKKKRKMKVYENTAASRVSQPAASSSHGITSRKCFPFFLTHSFFFWRNLARDQTKHNGKAIACCKWQIPKQFALFLLHLEA